MADADGSRIRATAYAFSADPGTALAKSVAAWFTGSGSNALERRLRQESPGTGWRQIEPDSAD